MSAKGGYNTNVAVGIMRDVYGHLQELPMALKEKKQDHYIDYTFEASLATAMTTYQDSHGVSHFDKKSSMYILGPQSAAYQHWNHIALRKRDDLFAFHSSLFKIYRMKTAFGDYQVILTNRNATRKYPTLTGNWASPHVLNSKEFFEIFAESFFDIDEFYGTICIELQQAAARPCGKIKFRGTITLCGDEQATLSLSVPAGQFWIIQDQQFTIDNITAAASSSFIIQHWDAERRIYE
ncbi:hypothetical protein EH222_13025 [candidate division KSB1 bacterium]|nr:MAG: hypothetical protein EH222_13025 [candidate division KSB1 bacterium]